MKKLLKSQPTPTHLDAYLTANPNDDWEQFKGNDRDGHEQVKGALKADQRGLCAYCEIDLLAGNGHGLDDFRVEHFIPQAPHNPPPNHALDWQNMLAVCSGGNARYVADPQRFTSPECSCDVPKQNNNWMGIVLDPINDIPAFPLLFAYQEHDGQMQVSDSCPAHLVDKATNSISNFNLKTRSFLNRSRKAVIDQLRVEIEARLDAGGAESVAADQLAQVYFQSGTTATWPAFFSCIRWYLGPAAERHLQSINYQG